MQAADFLLKGIARLHGLGSACLLLHRCICLHCRTTSRVCMSTATPVSVVWIHSILINLWHRSTSHAHLAGRTAQGRLSWSTKRRACPLQTHASTQPRKPSGLALPRTTWWTGKGQSSGAAL